MRLKILFSLIIIFGFSNIVFSSTPGIISSCQILDTSGTYTMNSDIISDGSSFCIDIQANNVNLDCEGNSLVGKRAFYGILLRSGYQYANIKNCEVYNFTHGILIDSNSDHHTLINITSHDNANNGFHIDQFSGSASFSPDYNSVYNSTFYGNGGHGIFLENGDYTTIYNVTSYNNVGHGIYYEVLYSGYSVGNTLNLSTFYNNGGYGLQVDTNIGLKIDFYNFSLEPAYSPVLGNIIQDYDPRLTSCQVLGFSGINYTLDEDIISDGSSFCIDIQANDINLDCQGNSLIGKRAFYGILLRSGYQYSDIINCEVYNFTHGILIDSNSDHHTLINITSHDNANNGFHIDQFSGDESFSPDYNSVYNSTFYGNGGHGIFLENGDYTTIYNVTSYDNIGYGIYYEVLHSGYSVGNTLNSSTFYNNGVWDLRLEKNIGASIYYNNFSNSSKIYSVGGNIFNSPGEEIGNYYSDFICNTNSSLNYGDHIYNVCTNPNNFSFSSVTDNAPLKSFLRSLIRVTATFVSPTENSGVTLNSRNWTLINVSSDYPIDLCILTWNGSDGGVMTLSTNYCYINKSDLVNGTYIYSVEVSTSTNGVANGITNSRSLSIGGETLLTIPGSIFPVQGFLSLLLIFIFLLSYFIFS